MKKCKSLAALVLCLLAAVTLLPVTALAAGSIDRNRDASLTVTEAYDGKALSGVTFQIYLVSTMDDTGELTPVDAFQSFASALDIRGENDEAWQALAGTLEREILLGSLGDLAPADTAVTDASGTVRFPISTMGLYLVLGTRTEVEGYVYATSPFFALIPEQDPQTNTWNYDVTARAKPGQSPVLADLEVLKIWKDDCHKSQRPSSITVSLVCDGTVYDTVTLPHNGAWTYTWQDLDVNHKWTVTEETLSGYSKPDIRQEGNTFIITNTCSKATTGKPNLPQTGLLWWPVPVLIAAGLLFVVIGLLCRRGSRDER